jgi:hypothetical protein
MDYIKYLCCGCFIENNHNKNIENVTNNICIIETPQIMPNNTINSDTIKNSDIIKNVNSDIIKNDTIKNVNSDTIKNSNSDIIKNDTIKNANSDTIKNANSDTIKNDTIKNKVNDNSIYDFNEDYDEVTSEDIEEYNDIQGETHIEAQQIEALDALALPHAQQMAPQTNIKLGSSPFASSIKNYFNKE